MKRTCCRIVAVFMLFGGTVFGQHHDASWNLEEAKKAMSPAYWLFWNDNVQQRIDEDIDRNRKAEAIVALDGVPAGTEIKIEQISHSFLFGGNIFLFGGLETPEKNRKYENTFGSLFNAATVPFYWKTLEPEQGKLRFEAGSPNSYRRPPTDPVVAFCEANNIDINGHAIIYGMRRWGHPEWMPNDRKKMEVIFDQHIKTLAERYADRVQRWDVVNESIHQAERGLMPDDYTYKAFASAMKYFPQQVQFNSNDCDIRWGPTPRYVEIVRDLIDRGIRIDNVGVQMHIFDPALSQRIAQGAEELTPEKNNVVLECLDGAERPIHISEVTVSAPDETPGGKAIQAIIARNLYRLWFSHASAMGITWWNVVDGGAAPGEPSLSGLYDSDVNPKPVYHMLDQLINHDWKTKLTVNGTRDGVVKFRGFKGDYRITWKDASGKARQATFALENDGNVNLLER